MDLRKLAEAIAKAEAFCPSKGQLQGVNLAELRRYAGEYLLSRTARGDVGSETYTVGAYAQFVKAAEKLEAATAHLPSVDFSVGVASSCQFHVEPVMTESARSTQALAKVRKEKPWKRAWDIQSKILENSAETRIVSYDE